MPTSVLSGPRLTISAAGSLSLSTNATATVIANPALSNATYAPAIGTSGVQINALYSAQVNVVASGTPTDLDVTALTDATGAALNFSLITGVVVQAVSIVAGENGTIGGGTNPLFGASFLSAPLKPALNSMPGGTFVHLDPQGVTTSGTIKTLRITIAAGSNVKFNVFIFGRAA